MTYPTVLHSLCPIELCVVGSTIRIPASVNEEHDGPRPGAASVGGSPDVEVQTIFAEGTLKGSPCRCDVGVIPDDNVSLHIF